MGIIVSGDSWAWWGAPRATTLALAIATCACGDDRPPIGVLPSDGGQVQNDGGLVGGESDCPYTVLGGPLEQNPDALFGVHRIALDPTTGEPVVAWSESRDNDAPVLVKRWNGTEWELIGTAAHRTRREVELDLAVLDSGEPVVAWSELLSAYELYANGWDAAAGRWQQLGGPLNLDGDWSAQYPSVQCDADGRPLVAWAEKEPIIDGGGGRVCVAGWDGDAWQLEFQHPETYLNTTRGPTTLAVNPTDGSVAFAFTVGSGAVMAFQRTEGTWERLPEVPSEMGHGNLDLAYGADGQLYLVVCSNFNFNHSLQAAVIGPGDDAWTMLERVTDDARGRVELVVDPRDDQPTVAYLELSGWVTVSKWNGQEWVHVCYGSSELRDAFAVAMVAGNDSGPFLAVRVIESDTGRLHVVQLE